VVKCTSLCVSLRSRPLQHNLFIQNIVDHGATVDHGGCKAGNNIHRLVRVTARNGLVLRDRRLDGSALTIQVRHRMADLGCEIGPQYAPEPTGPFRVRIEARQRGCDHSVFSRLNKEKSEEHR
jgi:hypothetical protein